MNAHRRIPEVNRLSRPFASGAHALPTVRNQQVVGSSPTAGSKILSFYEYSCEQADVETGTKSERDADECFDSAVGDSDALSGHGHTR